MTAIETKGLTKHFGDVIAVDDLDLTIEDGEIFGFLGPNGAGKSTTIDMILDFVRPTSGSVSVLGLDAQSQGQAVRQRIGVLPDAYQVYERLTGKQHIQFTIDMKDASDDPMDVLTRVGIPEAADRKAGGYSKGMRQRLALGMALVGDPDLLILDEPSTGLDPNGAREMRGIINEENDRGVTVFFSSHIMEQVEAVCDRVGIINKGRLVAVDTVDGLREASKAGETLYIQTIKPAAGLVDEVEALEFVIDAGVTDNQLRVRVEESRKFEILVEINENIAQIDDFTVVRSTLEDLFVQYTNEVQEIRA